MSQFHMASFTVVGESACATMSVQTCCKILRHALYDPLGHGRASDTSSPANLGWSKTSTHPSSSSRQKATCFQFHQVSTRSLTIDVDFVKQTLTLGHCTLRLGDLGENTQLVPRSFGINEAQTIQAPR